MVNHCSEPPIVSATLTVLVNRAVPPSRSVSVVEHFRALGGDELVKRIKSQIAARLAAEPHRTPDDLAAVLQPGLQTIRGFLREMKKEETVMRVGTRVSWKGSRGADVWVLTPPIYRRKQKT
jgi:hypothetical protein